MQPNPLSFSRPILTILPLVVILVLLTGRGWAQETVETPRAGASTTSATSFAEFASRHSLEEIRRWCDRSTPRRLLQTFFFAIYCYDLEPALIVNATDCLDYSGIGTTVKEPDAALMAHVLNSILSRRDVFLSAVPDEKIKAEEWTLPGSSSTPIVLRRQADGLWRFDARTVQDIGKMRLDTVKDQRQVDEARMKMSEGRTDPDATMRSFLADIVRHDLSSAARCLDLRDIPPKLRATRGPEMARKLAFVIQRCRFVYPQEILSDPSGWRYIWHSNHRGRIALDRVRQPDGKDAWLFNRGTLHNLDAMVKGFWSTPPDPRYEFLGVVVTTSMVQEGNGTPQPPPPGVPAELSSPRSMLRAFLGAMDDLEVDDSETRRVLSCMNLNDVPEADRTSIGLRLAAKLETILHHLNIDLLSVPDSWACETQTYGRDTEWQVSIARQQNGSWSFDLDTVARIQEMYERLPAEEKSRKDRGSRFGSARQTVRTLLQAIRRGDDALAAHALDLSAIPLHAQTEIGPILGRKLKVVLDRVGAIQLQEVPNDAEGPRHMLYRGSLGRISLEPLAEGAHKGEWRFTADTVSQIERMFLAAVNAGSPSGVTSARDGSDPITITSLGILLRTSVPGWLRMGAAGLELYQWMGLLGMILISAGVSWIVFRSLTRLLVRLLRSACFDLSRDFVMTKIRPLEWQLLLLLVVAGLGLLDLPVAVWGVLVPLLKSVWVGLMAWTAIRLVDLLMALYTNDERLQHRRNLSDMIVPTAARCLKLVVLIVAVSWEVYLVGNAEWVTRLLAGLGLVGLAASLAAQDTLKNFFGTVLLIGEHPFKIGDFIVVNTMEGVVESVGFRSTWIRTKDDSLITIPNSIIANASIDNRGARTSRRNRTVLSFQYSTPLDQLVAFRDSLRVAASRNPLILHDRTEICIHTLASSGVEVLVVIYFNVRTGAEELTARDAWNREILRQASEIGVDIAIQSQSRVQPHPAEGQWIPAPKLALRGKASTPAGTADVEAPRDGV